MGSTIIEQDFPYDILRRGARDASRHNKRVQDAARKQLKDIISQQDIITSEKNKKIRIKLKYLDQYRFIHNRDRMDKIGRDEFDELEKDEIIYRPQEGGGGGKTKPGQDEGEEIFEAEFTVEQITDMMIEQLKLPDLDEKKKTEIISETIEYSDIRRKYGSFSSVDRKRTIMANILRKSKLKIPSEDTLAFIDDDFYFRTWNVTQERHSNAVIFLMLDRSGSMSEDRIYAVKALYFWIVQFLRKKYNKVEIKFISHDWVAREMNEKDFFSISEGGGTKISSAYELCRNIIEHNYPSNIWNVYCFHASDGDSWEDENECIEIVNKIFDLGANLFAYTEIDIDDERGSRSTLYKMFEELMANREGAIVSTITNLGDILNTLRTFLRSSVRKSYT